MTINIFVFKGDLNGENRSGAFLFFLGIYKLKLIAFKTVYMQIKEQVVYIPVPVLAPRSFTRCPL